MSRPIEIRLTDEQCDALKREAEAAGLKFFDLCRIKLMAGLAEAPAPHRGRVERPAPRVSTVPNVREQRIDASEPDRLDRLEAMMLQMGETVAKLAHPAVMVAAAPVDSEGAYEVDDVVGEALAQVEAQPAAGYDEGYPERPGDGVRHVGRRKPLPLAGGALPRHLAGLLP